MWRWWGDWSVLWEIFSWNRWEYVSNQRKEKWDRNYSLISVQCKSQDKLIESKLFALQLKAWVEQWDLNLLSSDIFINDIKNLLKTWRAHENKLENVSVDRVKWVLRMETAWRVGVRCSQKTGSDPFRHFYKKWWKLTRQAYLFLLP